MRITSSEPGVYVSGAAHLALLLLTFVVFSDARPLDAPQESAPVDVITDKQFNEMTKGEKTAKATKPTPPKADRVAEVEEKKPTPPVIAKVDTPTPPPPLKRIPDPGEDDDTPTPPRTVAALPPPPQPAPPKAEKTPEPPPKPDAEVIEPPKPPVRSVPAQKPAPEQKPLDKSALSKLLADAKADQQANDAPKPPSRPKSGDDSNETRHKFDTDSLTKLLSHEEPGQKPSTGRAVNQTASIGATTGTAAKMSPSMWGQLDALLQDQYKKCWSYLGLAGETHYIPQIRVAYDETGRLAGQPSLLNPPTDPNVRNLADSALRAVRRCDPLKIPPQFAPYFDQWKARILRFDPEEMAG